MQALDREVMAQYTLTAHVQDKEIPQWECTSLIQITLTDVNDNSPSFILSNYTVFIPEDSPVGSIVEVMLAIDKDKGLYCIFLIEITSVWLFVCIIYCT